MWGCFQQLMAKGYSISVNIITVINAIMVTNLSVKPGNIKLTTTLLGNSYITRISKHYTMRFIP